MDNRTPHTAPSFGSRWILLGLMLIGPLAWTSLAPAQGPSSCAQRAEEIIAAHDSLPENIKSARGEELTRIHELVDQTINKGQAFLRDCPATEPLRPKVLYTVARLMALNNQRSVQALVDHWKSQNTGQKVSVEKINQIRGRYFSRVHSYLDEAKGLQVEPELAGQLDRLRGQSYWFTGEYDKSAEAYYKAILEHPIDDDPDQTLCALISALVKSGTQKSGKLEDPSSKFEATLVQCQNFIQRYPRSIYLPHVLHMKMKALIGLGRLEAAIDHLAKYDKMHRQAVAGSPIMLGGRKHVFPADVRSDFEMYLDQLEFYYGFINYALGNVDKTSKHLGSAIKFLETKNTKNILRPASQVFLTRTHEVFDSIQSLQGKKAPNLAFDPSGWISEQMEIGEETGNVVALYFSAYGSPRYYTFAKILEEYYQAHWHDGFRALWVTYPKGKTDVPGQRLAVAQQHQQLGLSYPAVMDMSDRCEVSRQLNVSIGGGTLVVLDRKGHVAWYKIDPTERDLKLAHRVFDRLLEQE